MWVHDLRDAGATCGGKAVGLAKLIAAGLDVPPGFAIADGAFRALVGDLAISDPDNIGHTLGRAAEHIATAEIPAALEREVRERAARLGPLLAVRSSATIEDGPSGAAAGVFSSRTAVPIDELWQAIRTVWTSALTPLAAAYARRRGSTIAIGVVVQSFVEGAPLVVYTRAPGRPESPDLLVQQGEHVTRHERDAADLPDAARLALRAENALACPTGVDVELIARGDTTTIVQARPIVHPVPRTLTPPPPAILAPLLDGRVWHWDVAHNPDPLSTAQQGLVERVEAADVAPYSMRLCGGFLYSASRGEPPATAPVSADDFATRAAELEARLGATLQSPTRAAAANDEVAHDWTPTVIDAIERYLAFYAIWARELSPLIRAARGVLPAKLRQRGVDQPDRLAAELVGPRESAVEACLFAAARGEIEESDVERHLGCLSPAWDVSVPTYAERPGVIRDAIARARRALSVATRGKGDAEPSRDATRPASSSISPALEPASSSTSISPAPEPASSSTSISPPMRPSASPSTPRLSPSRSASTPPSTVATTSTSPSPSRSTTTTTTTTTTTSTTTNASSLRSASGLEAIERALVEEIAIARIAADFAERDDALFARAQWLVRRAVLAQARALGIDAEDAFWLPLAELESAPAEQHAVDDRLVGAIDRADARRPASGIDPIDARRRAAGARAAAERAARWQMPLVVGGGATSTAIDDREALHGLGSGPRAAGRVVRFASLASAIAVGPGDVVVARAITPALAVLVAGCAALVSETGGPLDHGAALARELGIPCVVGCRDAWSVLTDGMLVAVDGDAGTVTRT